MSLNDADALTQSIGHLKVPSVLVTRRANDQASCGEMRMSFGPLHTFNAVDL